MTLLRDCFCAAGSPTHTAPGSPPRETFSSPNRPANKEALKQFMRNSRKVGQPSSHLSPAPACAPAGQLPCQFAAA